jgi:hypothetical protein
MCIEHITESLIAMLASAHRFALQLHPDYVPRLYALICDGDCMQPVYKHNQTLIFSKAEPWRVGDVVAVYRRPEAVPPGENPVLLKILSSAPPPSFFQSEVRHGAAYRNKVILRMLNPPRSIVLNAEDVLGIHKCLGPLNEEGER